MTIFEIPGPPVAKARHRTTKSGHIFTDPGTAAFEQEVAKAAMVAHLELQPCIPYTLSCQFYLSKRFWQTDLDNLLKSVMDGLGQYGKPYQWQDGQVVKFWEPTKHLCDPGEERTVVTVWEAL